MKFGIVIQLTIASLLTLGHGKGIVERSKDIKGSIDKLNEQVGPGGHVGNDLDLNVPVEDMNEYIDEKSQYINEWLRPQDGTKNSDWSHSYNDRGRMDEYKKIRSDFVSDDAYDFTFADFLDEATAKEIRDEINAFVEKLLEQKATNQDNSEDFDI